MTFLAHDHKITRPNVINTLTILCDAVSKIKQQSRD